MESTTYTLKDRRNDMIISLDTERAFWQNLISLNKSLRETRDISQYNKNNLYQAHNQHHPKYKETQNIFTKIKNK